MTQIKTSGPFTKIGNFFDNYGAILSNIIGTVILAFSTSLISNPADLWNFSRIQTWIEYAGVLFFVIGTCLMAKNGSRVAKLESENHFLNQLVKNFGDDIQEKWRHTLIEVAKTVELNNAGRISIYRSEKSHFIMLGRFSHDPEKQKTGRGSYPIEEGCIGKAFRDGEAFAFDIADPLSESYLITMKADWGISQDVARKFKMKARSIAAFALADEKSLKRSLVLVFESTETKAFKKKDLRAAKELYSDLLCGLEKTLEPVLPSLIYAKEKGF